MRWVHLETLRGSGSVTSNSGEKVAARHELEVYQEEEDTASTLTEPRETILGLKDVRGFVLPVSFFHEGGLLLEMEDGRQLEFRYLNRRGSIALNLWIG